jgi:hypothetical protein
MLDGIGFHPFYQAEPNSEDYLNYANDIKKFKKMCESYGFKGEYFASEWTWVAPYPHKFTLGKKYRTSELDKAKLSSQLTIRHAGLNINSFWNETVQTQFQHWAVGLNRITFSSDPIHAIQMEAIYYTQRTLSTIFDSVDPADISVTISKDIEKLEIWTFKREDGAKLICLWQGGEPSDKCQGTDVDVRIQNIQAKSIRGIDVLNGRTKELEFSLDKDSVTVKDVVIVDSPIVLLIKEVY